MTEISSGLNLAHFGRAHRYPALTGITDRIRGRMLRHSLSPRSVSEGMRLACLPGDHVSDKVIAEGLYEKQFLFTLLPTLAENSRILRETCMLDVGANIGNHACFFSRFFGKVLAFEPNPAAFHILAANVFINDLRNVVPLQLGLGVEAGTLRFIQDNTGNLGESAFTTGNGIKGVERFLSVVRGDGYLEENPVGMPVGFIKIDVQGFEAKVLQGLERTITEFFPVILFENEFVGGTSPMAMLQEMGYRRFFGFHESYFRFSDPRLRRLWRVLRNEIRIVEISDPAGFHDILALR